MIQRHLGGADGLSAGALGLGCMPLSSVYGSTNDTDTAATLDAALDAGITMWDTANVYGAGANEQVLAPWLSRHRGEITIATKFGYRPDGTISATPSDAAASIDESLARLGVEEVDLWYLHRVDPRVPIEDTVGAMAEAVHSGKVRHLGLSEASATTLRRAVAVHPIAALQSEWSLWTRDIESEVLPIARELGIGLVPYSPLGRGMLTASIGSLDSLDDNDHRRAGPRFSAENFDSNRDGLAGFITLARELDCTPAQLALAWLLAQGPDVIPIPGTRTAPHLCENAAAVSINLTADDLARIEACVPAPVGQRYARPHAYGDSPPPA